MAGPIISITEKGKEEAKRLIAQWEKENPGAYEKLKEDIRKALELARKNPEAFFEICLKAYIKDSQERDYLYNLYNEYPKAFFALKAFLERVIGIMRSE